ncbi:MAG TPA: SpoIID/LytB domain-containing protein [Candidatus Dormibacteraeota bacterium]|nr:SpoIID/LytB domain-containing protein [Candidatus Dormibacteraeota bacterium]
MRGSRARLALACVLVAAVAGCTGLRGPEPPKPGPAGAPGTPKPPATRPAPARGYGSPRSIRIGLAVASPRLKIAGSTPWTLRSLGGTPIVTGTAGDRITVLAQAPGAFAVFREGVASPVWSGGPGDTLELIPEGNGYSGWSGNWYRGTFRIHASGPEGLTLVNEVGFEDYLRSVLPNEIGAPPETDFAAVQAQAVAARSYTIAYLGRRADLGFDLYASVEDQVYAGKTRENPQSDRAVQSTRGEVLTSDGAPIRALYSSACGGRTANVEDVWPWDWTAYLRSVRDDAGPGSSAYCTLSSNFRWREDWDADAFLAALRQYGPAENPAAARLTGDLLDVRVDKRSRCGRVSDLAVSTTGGEVIFHGDRTRWVLRRPGTAAILRSSFFKIGVIRDEDGRATKVVASGGGNGHGIGMCQWGAMGMARAGMDYREILHHYYKSTRLERI